MVTTASRTGIVEDDEVRALEQLDLAGARFAEEPAEEPAHRDRVHLCTSGDLAGRRVFGPSALARFSAYGDLRDLVNGRGTAISPGDGPTAGRECAGYCRTASVSVFPVIATRQVDRPAQATDGGRALHLLGGRVSGERSPRSSQAQSRDEKLSLIHI